MWDFQSIIGGAGQGITGLISAGIGAYKAGKERKKIDKYLDTQDSENKSWYNENALSDYTQRADSQNLIRNMRENLSRRDKANANMSVVSGATPEQQAAAKEQSNQIVSSVYGNLGAMGQQWKDRISNQYLSRKYNIANQRLGIMDNKARNWETLMNNGIGTFADSFKTSAGGGGGSTPWQGISASSIPTGYQTGNLPQVTTPQYQAPTQLPQINWAM